MEVDPITRGLTRLYRYRRLIRLNAPLPILATSKGQLAETKEALGSRWSEVEARYPEYEKHQDAENTADLEWEKRCHNCAHWKGPPWEWQDEDLDIQEVRWCEQFKFDETSRPEECPGFSEKGDLN
jgi:hypothetical protein